MSSARLFLIIAAASGFTAVALGAFGAHGLRAQLSDQSLSAWQTGVLYQFCHTLVLLAVAVLLRTAPAASLSVAGWLFVAGIIFFSGSLYGLALGAPSWLGPITPMGGVCFMAGWVSLFIYALRY